MSSILVELRDLNPDAGLLDNMDEALIGIGRIALGEPIAVYSQSLIFAKLAHDGFSPEEASTYFQEKMAEWSNVDYAPVILHDVIED
jgi:hypothetical protein